MLPKDVYDSLRLEAAMKSTSMSKLAAAAIVSKIQKKQKKGDFLDYLAKNAYKGKNVPRDLSTNDEYLYGANIK
jgi:hypothetical protein